MLKDLTGRQFGSLVALSRAANIGKRVAWECLCDCGGMATVGSQSLLNGKKQSCGCLAVREYHGMTDTPEYRAWCCMKARALNPNVNQAHNYSERGITVCAEWVVSFTAFLNHIGNRPTNKHSVDRINNSKGYEPGNVRWATDEEQQNNTRRNVNLTIDGVTKTISQWARHVGLKPTIVQERLSLGWSPADAVKQPKSHIPIRNRRRFAK